MSDAEYKDMYREQLYIKVGIIADLEAELRDVRAENEKLRAELIEEKQLSEKENKRKRAYYQEVIAAEKVIAELRAENEKLRAALKPFAHEAQFISPHAEDTWFYYDGIRFGDLRAAAAALKETGDE